MRKTIVANEKQIALSAWLKAGFPLLPERAFREALKNRDIRVNGRRVSEDIGLLKGDEVTLYIPDEKLDGPPLDVAWVSENVVVAVKPPGVTSKADGETDMEKLVSEWLAKQGEDREVHACHRLDNQTGGLMVFARNACAGEAVRAMMDAGKIEKTYSCIVKGKPSPASGTLTSYMKKDAAKALVSVFDRPAPGARTAVTEYRPIATDGERTLLEVRLHTGRTHQIRAQMAHIGCPVLGDDKYGDREFNRRYRARRQKLWASGLRFAFSPEECPALAEAAGRSFERPAPFLDDLKNSL
jgi:23S rRNA pseudouridine955/2504/2580 synthase